MGMYYPRPQTGRAMTRQTIRLKFMSNCCWGLAKIHEDETGTWGRDQDLDCGGAPEDKD